MDIPVNVEVHCSEGLCGRSTYVLVDPQRKEVTHLVIKETEAPHTERMVPIQVVSDTAPDVILLNCTRDELDNMDPFIRTEIIREEMPDVEYAPYGYVPLGAVWTSVYPVPDRTQVVAIEHKQVPLGERAIRRGTHVEATDGRVGQVDELIVHPKDRQITHIVMREGHLWGQKEIAIPISEIDRIEDDTVHLRLSKEEVKALETIPVQ
jgi:sporulation protein YlmC with PRC-barrel domain